MAADLAGKPWAIRRVGVTPDAEDFAHDVGIMPSGQVQIEQLANIMQRF
jgi:hypothetical protein